VKTGTTPIHTGDDGLPATIYYTKDYRDTFVVDLSANYDIKINGHTLTLGVEVLNLFNRKNEVTSQSGASSSPSDEYSMGRQYYANIRYDY
jgi:outer membrane receptor for ferrienterochelin and colicin